MFNVFVYMLCMNFWNVILHSFSFLSTDLVKVTFQGLHKMQGAMNIFVQEILVYMETSVNIIHLLRKTHRYVTVYMQQI